MDERKQRQEELLLIEQKRQELDVERQQIAQIRHSIDQHRYDLQELEPFIPLARQLQAMKIDITNFLPWVETINEYAVTRNTDLTTAAYNIADHLREYRQLGSLHKAIEHTRQQLSVLDAFTAQKQQALSILMNLQAKGVTDAEIVNLVNFPGRWNKQWSGLGMGQGNGGVNGGKTLVR